MYHEVTDKDLAVLAYRLAPLLVLVWPLAGYILKWGGGRFNVAFYN